MYLCTVQQGLVDIGWDKVRIVAVETDGAASFAAAKAAGKVRKSHDCIAINSLL